MSSDDPGRRLQSIVTQWTLVRRAHGENPTLTATDARQALVLSYAKAIRRYVAGMLRVDDQADEVAQDVIVRLLRGDFCGADPDRGRFRDLLRVAVRNMVRNHWAKQKRRRPVELELDEVYAEDEKPWLEACSANLLETVWSRLEEYERENPGRYPFRLLRFRMANPEASSEELARRLSAHIGQEIRADAVRQQLKRARARFAELLVQEVAQGLHAPTSSRIEEELIALGLHQLLEVLPETWKDRWLS